MSHGATFYETEHSGLKEETHHLHGLLILICLNCIGEGQKPLGVGSNANVQLTQQSTAGRVKKGSDTRFDKEYLIVDGTDCYFHARLNLFILTPHFRYLQHPVPLCSGKLAVLCPTKC